MNLNYEQLVAITSGAARTWEDAEGFHVCRFSEELVRAYFTRNYDFGAEALTSSGVVLRFITDSPAIKLSVVTKCCSTRKYFAVDIVVDDQYIGSLKNYDFPAPGSLFSTLDVPLGAFSEMFNLGKGEKNVTVYLPWSVECVITSLELDDGASVIPVKRGKKLLAFGDSITQGYDALQPRNKYTSRLADYLGYEEINKAIAGEVFWPELVTLTDEVVPDLITVAYGTNDFTKRSSTDLLKACRKFYTNLCEMYPITPIFALSPVWRKDHTIPKESYEGFDQVEKIISQAVCDLPGVTIVKGWELVPHDEILYGDLRLHPNDEGFKYYFENLLHEINRISIDEQQHSNTLK